MTSHSFAEGLGGTRQGSAGYASIAGSAQLAAACAAPVLALLQRIFIPNKPACMCLVIQGRKREMTALLAGAQCALAMPETVISHSGLEKRCTSCLCLPMPTLSKCCKQRAYSSAASFSCCAACCSCCAIMAAWLGCWLAPAAPAALRLPRTSSMPCWNSVSSWNTCSSTFLLWFEGVNTFLTHVHDEVLAVVGWASAAAPAAAVLLPHATCLPVFACHRRRIQALRFQTSSWCRSRRGRTLETCLAAAAAAAVLLLVLLTLSTEPDLHGNHDRAHFH